ncbi:MAG: YbfB/YjiJ family MFS transporter [Alphaproteobacteria bacterium]|nr:YbfB/YjiJ family MFS transporter [Alphaproteobacteria bacterium]
MPGTNPWRGTLSALCALLVGIGLARFAYTPLFPALVTNGWFTATQAAYLGAANLVGYLAGALLARRIATLTSTQFALRWGMVLASASFFACAEPQILPWPYAWFFLWRFASGLSGGVLMVLAAPTVLPFVPPSRQGLAGGMIFAGVGLGIALSGTLIPQTLVYGLSETWAILGGLALLLTAVAWHGWPATNLEAATEARKVAKPPSSWALKSLYLEYCLNSAGLIPHMVFLVVFIAQGLSRGLLVGAYYWIAFGIGAVFGPLSVGYLADKIGVLSALRLGYGMQAAFVGILFFTDNTVVLILSSIIMGAFVPGCTTLVLARLRELIPGNTAAQTGGWGLATTAFAVGQAGGAYSLSYLFDLSGNYTWLYACGAGAIASALMLNLAMGHRR